MTSPNVSMKERRDQREQALGPVAGPIYNALHDQVADLHAKWYQYRILYVESKKSIPVLNGTAPYLFGLLQDVLWKDVVLHIAKLMDPPEQKGGVYKNLTLPALVQAVSVKGLDARLAVALRKTKQNAAFAIRWRNKNLAHLDQSYALGTNVHPLQNATVVGIERALIGVSGVMNAVERHFWTTEFDFTAVVMEDARSLLHFLRTGIEADKAKRSAS